jgi:chromosome partitioning protein
MAFIMPIMNVKGGCGKSITALALSRVLTEADSGGGGEAMRVLIVDIDPQRTVSDALDIGPSMPTMAEAIKGEIEPRDAIATDGLFGCDIIPGGLRMLELFNCDPMAVVKVIKAVADDYDLIVIDTPGTLDNTVKGALMSVDGSGMVLVPSQLSYADTNAVGFSIDQFRLMGIEDYRVVAVMVDARSAKENAAFRDELRNYSGGRLLKTEIPKTVLAARLAGGEEPEGPHARAFFTTIRQLAVEIMEAATDG